MPTNKRVEPHSIITNLPQYIFLKDVRASTSLIDGKIIYDNREWSRDEYDRCFPEPRLIRKSIQLDSTQIKN